MVRSMFAAIAGLKSHQTRMDVIGNNIANINTWGYKSQSANFADTMYQTTIQGKEGTATTGGKNSSQVGFGVDVGSITTNYTTGSRNPTGRDNECMINGPAFFMVSSSNSATGLTTNSAIKLSRVGIFTLDNNGYLVDQDGNFVYGYNGANPPAAGTEGAPAAIKADLTGGNIVSIRFLADGTITGVRDDANSTPVVIGKLGVASVENVNGLEKTAGYYYNIGPNAGKVKSMTTNASTGDILGGYLEMSNANLADEMANMIITQRGYQANTKMITVTDEMLQELVNMKR